VPTATYDPSESHLLSDAARELHDDELAAHAVTAEQLLGFRGITLTGTDAEDAVLAVTHQVNFQVARPQMFGLVAGESKGDQSVQYRQLPGGTGTYLDPTAVAIAERLLGGQDDGWASVRNVR
jgi:hypothetical protein